MKVIGVMSGTSLDGLDLAYCNISLQKDRYEIMDAITLPYPDDILELIQAAYRGKPGQIHDLDLSYTKYLGQTIKTYIDDLKAPVDLVSSHGHTVFHQPKNGLTFQMGNLPELAQWIGKKVVCNFRVQDVALGGQGAPLVPIGDQIIYPVYTSCVNLGGFANISYEADGLRWAYDLSPCNIVLNQVAHQLGALFDDQGQWARQGKIHRPLLEALQAIPFYGKKPPKSLGREWLEIVFLPILDRHPAQPKDQLATLTHHFAYQIGRSLPPGKCLMTGGGALNTFLLEKIKDNASAEICLPSKLVIEYKEALIFALLGVLRVHDQINVLHSVTGATKDHCSGWVHEP